MPDGLFCAQELTSLEALKKIGSPVRPREFLRKANRRRVTTFCFGVLRVALWAHNLTRFLPDYPGYP